MDVPVEATPQDASAALDGGQAILVDVREPWEYDEQHIRGAVLIPLAELPDRLAEIPDDRTVYVHCHRGGRSSRAAEYLRAHGRPRSVNVTGGIEAWSQAGLPTE